MQDLSSIIESNIGLIKAQLRRLNLLNEPDAESIGYEALYNAIISYDSTKGYKLSTYATCCIYNALSSYIRTLNKKKQLDIISYNNVAYVKDGEEHEFVEFLADENTTEQEFMKQELQSKIRDAFNTTYNGLTNEKHKAIITVWQKAGYDISGREVAEKTGVSQPYVNQVINIFKANIKKRLEDYL